VAFDTNSADNSFFLIIQLSLTLYSRYAKETGRALKRGFFGDEMPRMTTAGQTGCPGPRMYYT
jgi:hypothetical protein